MTERLQSQRRLFVRCKRDHQRKAGYHQQQREIDERALPHQCSEAATPAPDEIPGPQKQGRQTEHRADANEDGAGVGQFEILIRRVPHGNIDEGFHRSPAS